MRKAASLALSIAKPCDELERYDFIARVEKVCLRVQVKSVARMSPSRRHYRIKTSGGSGRLRHTPYTAEEIDFLVAYIFPEDLWYVFPAKILERRVSLCVWPGSKKSSYEQYREAWELMFPAEEAAALPVSVATLNTMAEP